jgi:hypothetical protein
MVGFDFRPASLVSDFYPMHPATRDAKAYLRAHGLNVPEADPPDPSALDRLAITIRSDLKKRHAMSPEGARPDAV